MYLPCAVKKQLEAELRGREDVDRNTINAVCSLSSEKLEVDGRTSRRRGEEEEVEPGREKRKPWMNRVQKIHSETLVNALISKLTTFCTRSCNGSSIRRKW